MHGAESPRAKDADYRSILVVVTRRIGDVFLTGALLRTLKRAWPQARLDLLVFKGTEDVSRTHPDVDQVLTVSVRASLATNLGLMRRLWRRYDLALSTSPSDRPSLYAWAAGRRSVGIMGTEAKHLLKRLLLSQTVAFELRETHSLALNLRLADALGIERTHEVPLRWGADDERRLAMLFPGYGTLRYAVLHPYPKFRYKMWTEQGWRSLAAWLRQRDIAVVVTGGPDASERAYVDALFPAAEEVTANLVGKLGFPEIAALIARATLYVGPDTVTSHLAAATGTPTVALFGPSNPVVWGPWPRAWVEEPSPYAMHGSQLRGNVALVQGAGDCVPCLQEGCDRHVGSDSKCLLTLPAGRVIEAVESLLRASGRET